MFSLVFILLVSVSELFFVRRPFGLFPRRILRPSCSCTVVGWELHPAGKHQGREAERTLQYLPRVIYIKFEGVSWRVHPELDVGVFPLKPVTRTWVVNRKTEAKASRRGFPLVPDFASTAHMMQGMNLAAAIADCGDVMDTPTLKTC